MKKKLLSVLMLVVMVFSLIPTAAFAATVNNTYTPGTYTGSAEGFAGDVTVEVTLTKDGQDVKISDIKATGEKETPSYWAKVTGILDTIKAKNGTDGVDTVSGATYSSQAILDATDEALSKASSSISGSGTQTDPYTIANAAQLAAFASAVDGGETYQGKYVVLSGDIDLSGIDSWNPIGGEAKDSANIFRGTFDGKGRSISGLKINVETQTEGNYGLFSMLGNQAVVRNLNVTDANVTVTSPAEAIRAGVIAGDTEKTAGSGDAGLAARIDGCSATGAVSVTTTGDKLAFGGGIVGRLFNGGVVTNCWTDVNVTVKALNGSKSAYAGGIAGTTGNYAVIANCATLGDCTAIAPKNSNFGGMAGGIVSMLAGKQYNVYAAGNMTVGNGGSAHKWVGVLDGQVTVSGMKNNAYPAQGALRLHNYYNQASVLTIETYNTDGTLSGSAATDTVGCGLTTQSSPSYDKVIETTAKAAADMATAAFAETLNGNIQELNGILTAYGITGIELREWQLKDGKVLPTGNVWVSGEIDASIFASGDGTEENPYLIKTEEQLKAFAVSMNDKIDYTGKYVALGDDIAVSGEWKPIGGSDYLFNGTFDGQGHSISGMALGTKDAPYALDRENLYIGLFGVLGPKSTVKNVHLKDVAFYTSYEATAYLGGIAGVMQGSTTQNDYTGAVIDGCSVEGTLSLTAAKGNQFVGGIAGMQYKGAIINSSAKVDASGVVTSGDLAEVGGLVGINNRGLVANCWSDSTIYGSGSRENGNEGMAVVSNLIACNAGALVNCYGSGNVTTREHSTYAGMVTGWVTGIGKSYTCWYNLESTMTVGTLTVNPVESIGTKVASGVTEEGDIYTGGLVDKMTGYNAAGYAAVADRLNETFAAFPIDITLFGLANTALKNWTYDADGALVTFGETNGFVTYVQPECEKVVKPEQKLQDGTWYGRDDEKTTVVKITVVNNEITATEVLSGSKTGEAYDAALAKATYKATYGDFSHYEAADPSRFAGGTGTESDPYLIADEAQLRYLSYSVNADVNWSGVYFKQTADIALTSGDWQPIGWALNGEVNGKKTAIAAYPFRGNYDGAGYTISGLTIGTAAEPVDQMASGLFGLTAGSYSSNEQPTGDEQVVRLKGIHLRDISIHVSTRYETYTGGLVGSGQNGIYIDDCSVTGEISAVTSESFARAGGLASSVLRGAVTNSWADVDITAETDTNHVYAGGFYGMDNRVTTVNCYALGDVTANSTNNNKVHIGGFVGQSGGIHVNCYAAGDVVSLKTTTDVGIFSGRSAGITVDYHIYHNTDALLRQGDTTVSPAAAIGVVTTGASETDVTGKTAAELGSEDFAALLNANLAEDQMSTVWAAVAEALAAQNDRGFGQQNYYTGNQLLFWIAKDGVVTFGSDSTDGGDDGDDIPVSYIITATAGAGGSISPSGEISVLAGGEQAFVITPDAGYAVSDVKIDGKSIGAVKDYTFENVSEAHTIEVVFVKDAGTPAAKTGDSGVALWSILLPASALALVGAVVCVKKRRAD